MTVESILNKREELVAALAEMDATREYLEAALAEAEAALVNTVTDASTIDVDRVAAMARVDKARARCRQLRAAIVETDRSEWIAQSREPVDPLLKSSEELTTSAATAGQPSTSSSSAAPSAENRRSEHESRKGRQIHRSALDFSVRATGRSNGVSQVPLVRQAIGLSGLALTYLVYYFIDVQLQILTLHAVFPSPFH